MRGTATSSLAHWFLVLLLVVGGFVGCCLNWSAVRQSAIRFMIVQLQAGKVHVIDGKAQQHRMGEFWAVPARSSYVC